MVDIKNFLLQNSFVVGLTIRLVLMIVLPILLDDGYLLHGVKYTDIDYDVFMDAAAMVHNGKSPYDRHTYRYTPFLAAILSWGNRINISWFGRGLFCVSDAFCGLIILKMRKKSLMVSTQYQSNGVYSNGFKYSLEDAMWWMYNPLAINICTRGSAESFIVLLPVLLTIYIATTNSNVVQYFLVFQRRSQEDILIRASLCGIIHGIAIHAKLYPIIYTPSFMAFFSRECGGKCWEEGKETTDKDKNQGSSIIKSVFHFITIWIKRILRPAPMAFLLISMIFFVGLTVAGIEIYGEKALEEGLLYHFSRVDHRHNYSIYWYAIYLVRYREYMGEISPSFLTITSGMLFFPQAALLLVCSVGIAPHDLCFALFLQTFVFVIFNKVITGQYFTWYLCLLPLCSNRIRWSSRKMAVAFMIFVLSMVSWMISAFFLEMKGYSIHLIVWLASLFVFLASLNLFRVILSSYEGTGARVTGLSDHKKHQ